MPVFELCWISKWVAGRNHLRKAIKMVCVCVFFPWDDSVQIIATSHDLTPNGGLVRENPLYLRETWVGEIL